MDAGTYYANTIVNAAKNIGPIILYLVVGYFVFIKLPFMFMVKVNKENKPKPEEPKKPELKADPKSPQLDSVSHQERMRQRAQEIDDEIKRKEKFREEERQRQERKRQERAEHNHKKEEPKKEVPPLPLTAAARLFDFKSGEEITKAELKKRYHELLRQNHPDKVAQLGSDFKVLAEKKTKDINSAYEELKKKAS